jgi:hypothetical protein
MFLGKILLLLATLHKLCKQLRPRIFIHTLVGSDSNLFWTTIVNGNSHQLSILFGRRLVCHYDKLKTGATVPYWITMR